MKYSININQKIAVDHKLSLKAVALLDLFSELSTWATPEVFDNGVYYQLAYSKILNEIPLVFSKKDTMYRCLKELKDRGFVEQRKKGRTLQNFIRLSAKGKSILRFGKKTEAYQGSEINPTRFGNKSEAENQAETQAVADNLLQGSEINPTYNNNNTIDNIYIAFEAYQFIKKTRSYDLEIWELQNKKFISDYRSFLEYFEIKVQEEEIEFTSDKLFGRLKRLKFNWKNNNTALNQLSKKPVMIGG